MNSESPGSSKYTVPHSIRIPKRLDDPLRKMAEWQSCKFSTVINDALQEYINRHYKEFKKAFEEMRQTTGE